MVTLEEIFGHPLNLLLIRAGVSSLVIPWVTNKWQDNRKKLEIMVDIVSQMPEEILYQLGSVIGSIDMRKQEFTDAEKYAFWENERKWFTKLISYVQESKSISLTQTLQKDGMTIESL
jgi:hypothetical protein